MEIRLIIKKIFLIIFTLIIGLFFLLYILSGLFYLEVEAKGGYVEYPPFPHILTSAPDNTIATIKPAHSIGFDNSELEMFGYEDTEAVIVLNETDDSVYEFTVNIPETGDYFIAIDYYNLNATLLDTKVTILVNGELQNPNHENTILQSMWMTQPDSTSFDSYGNQTIPQQVAFEGWFTSYLRDQRFLEAKPLLFHLLHGNNTIAMYKNQGSSLIGDIHVVSYFTASAYVDPGTPTIDIEVPISLEAEDYTYKSDLSVLPGIEKSPSVSPFATENNLINIIEPSFQDSGDALTYYFNVENEGYYYITLRYKNDIYSNRVSYIDVYVNGELQFAEAADIGLDYSSSWQSQTLGDEYRFYFHSGLNSLTIEASASKVADEYSILQNTIEEISAYGLEVKKLTGGSSDKHREWDIAAFLPETMELVNSWETDLISVKSSLTTLKSNSNRSAEYEKQLDLAIMKIQELKADIDQIPHKMDILSEGSTSALQLLVLVSEQIIAQPISLDKIYISGNIDNLPDDDKGFIIEMLADIEGYKASGQTDTVADYDIEVWVNRSRYYINTLQQMTDTTFTAETGIKVRFSIMPNEQKLILANAANTQPDVAIGVSGWVPFELGLRGAAADLSQFEGFYETISHFSPGSMIHQTYNGGVYGLPETQDFMVTFYRNDIFDSLGLAVPETYDQIIDILPTLQRYGMNYFLPLSGDSSFKAFSTTTPFIFQFGGDLYSDDGIKTAIDSVEAIEGITIMVEFYTLYSLPLQVANFYNSFRDGTIPIGVSSFNTYVQLMFAAPEIANKWSISLAPGYEQVDGEVHRDNVGTAQSVLMFEKSTKKEESWQFLEWWLSTKTQTDYANNLISTYGDAFLWNSSNLDAFASLPIAEEDKQIILEQWQYIHETPKVPGGYTLERELSNIWNTVVFDGTDVRSAIDDSVRIINRELERRLIQFNYLDNYGNIIRPYMLTTMDEIIYWQSLAEEEDDVHA